MYSYVKTKGDKQGNDDYSSSGVFMTDYRPQSIDQKKLQGQIDGSSQVMGNSNLQTSINNSSAMVSQRKINNSIFGGMAIQKKEMEEEPKQMKKEEEEPKQMKKDEDEMPKQLKAGADQSQTANPGSKSGMPSNLKSGIENLSGTSMDDVKVHYNSSKPAELNALAYAQGNEIHLGAGQEKHLPHEAWHVVQQRQGRVQPTVQMKGAAVNDDSNLEKEADIMGQKALVNHSSPVQMKKSHSYSGNVTQLYTDIPEADQTKNNWGIGSDARVADTGETVTSNTQRFVAFAAPWLITFSNNLLKAKGSGIEITAGSKKVKGPAPDTGTVQELTEVVPTIKASTSSTGTQNFWADCGRSSREVMGKHGTDTAPHGVYNDNSGKLQETVSSKNPGNFRDEILVKAGLGKDADSARLAYLALTPDKKEEFDKLHKINKYAAPEVGEAFVSRRDDKSTMKGFNFHWGGVIMTPGKDRVTLENFAKPGTNYDTKDEKWYFETYGPASKKGQTFHERNEGSVGAKGKNNITMSASTSPLVGKTNDDITLQSKSNSTSAKVADLSKGTEFKIIDRMNYWSKVTITSGPEVGKVGWIRKDSIAY